MRYVLIGAIAVILATIVTAYAGIRCTAVCSNGQCQQYCWSE
jgi:hypothetical protein